MEQEERVVSYDQKLQGLVELIPGSLAAGLSGLDGIGIGFYSLDPNFDAVSFDAEFANLFSQSNRIFGGLNLGDVGEHIFISEKIVLLLRGVGKDFYLMVILQAGVGNLGLARLQMKKAAQELERLL